MIEVPEGAKIIHVGLDPMGEACLWCEVDPDAKRKKLSVAIVGTGHPVPEGSTHRGSFVKGPYVWHIYTT